jgi:hypothetical protein
MTSPGKGTLILTFTSALLVPRVKRLKARYMTPPKAIDNVFFDIEPPLFLHPPAILRKVEAADGEMLFSKASYSR